MIESIGYTDDGQVWIRLMLEVNGQSMAGTLMLKPEFARQVATKLNEASDQVDK